LARTRKDGFYAPAAENDTACVTWDEKIRTKVVGDAFLSRAMLPAPRLHKEKPGAQEIPVRPPDL
jgi:hypothetical protein